MRGTAGSRAPTSDWWRGAVIYQIYPRSLPGHQWRRHRRPAGHHRAARLRRRARRRRDLDLALLHLADEGFRLRRLRLPRRRSDVRHAGRFRRAGRRGARARPQGHDRPGALAHLGPASLVQREPARAATNPQGRLVRLGRRQARRHAAQQLAVDLRRLGLAVGHAPRMQYYLHNFLAEQPDLNFHNPRGAGRAARRRRASGWSAASTASASTRSTSTSTARGCEDNPAAAAGASATPRPRRRSIPTTSRTISTTRASRRTSTSCERLRALLDEYPATAAVGEIGDGQRGAEDRGRVHRRRRQAAHGLHLRLPRRRTFSAGAVPRGASRPSRPVAGDGWACWAFSNHDVVRHVSRWAADERRPRRLCSRLAVGDPAVAARLGLPLPGRGTGPDRGRPRLRGSAAIPTASASGRSSRAATAAARRWSGKRTRRMAASRPASPGCRCRRSTSPRAVDRAGRATRPRCSSTTGASSPSAARIRRWPRATIDFLDAPTTTCSPSRAESGNEQIALRLQPRRGAARRRRCRRRHEVTAARRARLRRRRWTAANDQPRRPAARGSARIA